MEQLARVLAEFCDHIDEKYRSQLQWRMVVQIRPSVRSNDSTERECVWLTDTDKCKFCGLIALLSEDGQVLFIRRAAKLMREIVMYLAVDPGSKVAWLSDSKMSEVASVCVLPLIDKFARDVDSLEWFFVTRLNPRLNKFIPIGWTIC